jgi:hypothetical protein
MKTLGNLHALEAFQDFSFKDNPVPTTSSYLHNIHSDIRELDENDARKFSDKDKIYKQHIYPSANNMKLLNKERKVVLLRDPKDICLAYRRGALKNVHALLPGFSAELSEDEWMKKADETGLYTDLESFFNSWSMKDASGNTLIVGYDSLIKTPEAVVRNIESFWNLDLTEGKIVLARERYSRRTWASNTLLNTKKHTKKIIVTVLEAMGIKNSIRRLIRKN